MGAGPSEALLFFLPFTIFAFWLSVVEVLGRELKLETGLIGFVEERTVGPLTLSRDLCMFDSRLAVRRIGFRTLSRTGRLDEALLPLLGCGDRPMLTLDFLRPVDELDRVLDRVLAEFTDESLLLRGDWLGPNDALRWTEDGAPEVAAELRFGIDDLREVELWLLFSLACLQSYRLTGSFNKA